jgi:hypothetical protein
MQIEKVDQLLIGGRWMKNSEANVYQILVKESNGDVTSSLTAICDRNRISAINSNMKNAYYVETVEY